MRTAEYDMHGLVRMRVEGYSAFTLDAFNRPLSRFLTAASGSEADIRVSIGPFRPDLEGCFNVDHRYFLRPGFLFFRGTDKGLAWEAEIRGLDNPDGPISVRWHAPAANRMRFPWTLFPEMVLHLYLLIPLLELALWRRGHFLFHSAAVERDGKACLIAGRGGAGKTTFVMELLRKGWRLLGDDLVILGPGKALAFPTVEAQLEYFASCRATEELSLGAKLGLFAFLAAGRRAPLPTAASAALGSLNLILSGERESPVERGGWDAAMLAVSLRANQLMERSRYVGYRFSTTAFLDAYAYVFPEAGLQGYVADLDAYLGALSASIPFRVLEVPRRWNGSNIGMLLLP